MTLPLQFGDPYTTPRLPFHYATVTLTLQGKTRGDSSTTIEVNLRLHYSLTMRNLLMTTSSDEKGLPVWQNTYRALPNAIARSALFNTANLRSGGERAFFNAIEIASTNDIVLTYTGEELRQDDEDVFLQVLHLAKEQKLGEDIGFTANSMVVSLGWTRNSESYRRLHGCMRRLKATAVELTMGRVGFSGSLLSSFQWREDEFGDPSREWRVSLDRNIVKLFDPDTYSLIHWPTRLSLPPMARWLHSYYSTHRDPFPVSVELLYRLTGSRIAEMKSFRFKLKQALQVLVKAGFLSEAQVDSKRDVVIVKRAFDRKLLE